jgi:hypothetical protein
MRTYHNKQRTAFVMFFTCLRCHFLLRNVRDFQSGAERLALREEKVTDALYRYVNRV